MNLLGGKRRGWLMVTVVATMLAWTSALPAGADPGPFSSPTDCPGAPLGLKFGTATPVLLVHGFNEGPNIYTGGSPSLVDAIKAAIPNATTIAFNYEAANTDWVTNTAIGPQLAQCITWLAHTSYAKGGPGKVIIVAHSMGGLAVRCAIDPGCVKSGSKGPAAKPEMIGVVVTLGTPNTGSMLANIATLMATRYRTQKIHLKSTDQLNDMDWLLCQKIPLCKSISSGFDTQAARALQVGAPELNSNTLKPLPSSIPLDAIAGKITLITTLLGAGIFKISTSVGDLGDLVVSVRSAQDTQGVSPHPGPGKWNPTIDCGSIPVDSFVGWPTAPFQLPTCWHESESTSPTWQSDIITAMRPVAQTLSLLACTPGTITAALAAKDPANAAQRTLVTSACSDGWGVVEVHQPLTLSDGSVVKDTGIAILKRTDSGWSSEGLSDGTCIAAPDICPGVKLPPTALLHLLLRQAGLSLTPTQAELYINTVFTPGQLYKYPSGPPKIGIDNHNYIDGLQWAPGSQSDLVGTGTLHYEDCNPSCVGGTYEAIPVQITASHPQRCSVQLYPKGLGNPSQTVNADVFNQIDVKALQGNPPSFLVGTSVLQGPCK